MTKKNQQRDFGFINFAYLIYLSYLCIGRMAVCTHGWGFVLLSI